MKRIITCSDGTWNKPGAKDGRVVVRTNVEKFYKCLADIDNEGARQVKVYDAGVGTDDSIKDKLMGGISGAGIDKNIKDVYTFLILNYEPGDEIFLLGFSRGAYTARSLGGFIRNCGILKPEYIHLTDRAYELYRDRNKYTHPDSDMMVAFKRNYSWEETRIKFLGVWDTVGSLGIPLPWFRLVYNKRYDFHDVTLGSHVDHAYHALAIDEKRKPFTPTLWNKSKTVMNDPKHIQKMEQRWFVGVHSNIGGGYKETGLSDITLKWMIEKATYAGLSFKQEEIEKIDPNPNGVLRNSFSLVYYLWGPEYRKIDLSDQKSNQTLDNSVWVRYDSDPSYRPKNLKADLHRKSS